MSDNKFIKHLRGEDTSKSVLEIANQRTTTSFANMPQGTSNANDVYSDHRGNATAVLKGTDNWKLNDNALTFATTVYGDGRDFTDEYSVSGAGLWVNAVYTFTDAKIFMPNTKWVLKLCGNRLFTELHEPIALTLLIKFGTSTLISKTFFVRENSFNFSEELVIDFDESVTAPIKVAVGDTMTVQVLCGDATAQAEIYNGMTVLTALQRKVDGEAVASDTRTFDDVENELEDIHDDIDDLKDYVDDNFVNIDGTSIMTGPLKMRATQDFKCAIAPYWDGIGFFKLNDNNSVTLMASLEYQDSFMPAENNVYNIGSSSKKWKNLYLSGKAFVATINNGGDLGIPANTTGTLATKADVDLAANSGRMITDQGVWYAKMYAGTTPPARAEVEGRNYADFSQVDGNNNPIIVIYTYTNGAWDSGTTVVPPADYDGYVPITSKIWDIAEQAGQQGGRVLWNHQSKDFTPYPLIVSFDGQNITNSTFSYGTITNSTFSGEATLSGNSTVTMSENPTNDSIVNKEYVDTHAGTSSYRPDIFDWKWADHICNDVQWLRADTFSWQDGSVYQAAYNHLYNEYNDLPTEGMYRTFMLSNVSYYRFPAADHTGDTYQYAYASIYSPTVSIVYASSDSVLLSSTIYNDSTSSATSLGQPSMIADARYRMPIIEKIAGTNISYYLASDGHKICLANQESNVSAIYTATGVAWYYILDTTNQRFKLPRTKFGVTGLRDTVGKYVEAGAPNITGTESVYIRYNSATGAFKLDPSSSGTKNASGSTYTASNSLTFDASRSSSVYGNSTTIQPPATQMYLYFYVGEFTQTALENTAGINTELFNDKVDLSSSWGFPDGSYDTLTFGASGTQYTAPADGWFQIRLSNTGLVNHWVNISYVVGNTSVLIGNFWAQVSNNSFGLPLFPAKKGLKLKIEYGSDITGAVSFRFFYAQKTN